MIDSILNFRKPWENSISLAEKSYKVANTFAYWTGFTDLQTGVEKIHKKEYRQGVFHLLKGSLHAAILVIVARQLFSSSQSSHFLRRSSRNSSYAPSIPSYAPSIPSYNFFERSLGPIPEVAPVEEYNYCEGEKNPITIVTAYNDSIKDYAEPILENQRAYAEKHKYCYAIYKGDLAHDNGLFRAPYWSKIVAIWDQWKKAQPGKWIVWMDASAIVTNTDKTFREIIQEHGGDGKDVILTEDAMPQYGIPINNAVFAFKKNDWTNNWIQRIWSRSDLSIGGEGNCGSRHYPHCHYEQEAMTNLWQKDVNVNDHTSLIPNRKMNSFYRFSHYDQKRDMNLNYDGDNKPKFHWAPGDFICKVTGMEGRLRTPMTRFILDKCIDEPCVHPQNEEDVISYQRSKST